MHRFPIDFGSTDRRHFANVIRLSFGLAVISCANSQWPLKRSACDAVRRSRESIDCESSTTHAWNVVFEVQPSFLDGLDRSIGTTGEAHGGAEFKLCLLRIQDPTSLECKACLGLLQSAPTIFERVGGLCWLNAHCDRSDLLLRQRQRQLNRDRRRIDDGFNDLFSLRANWSTLAQKNPILG